MAQIFAKNNKFTAVLMMVFAAVINFSCSADDIDDTGRRSTSYAKSTESSELKVDEVISQAVLNVTVVKTTAEGTQLSPMSGEAIAKVRANIQQDPLQTAIMDKEFEQPVIETTEVNGTDLVSFTIKVNDGNVITGTVNMTRVSVYDNNYSMKVNAIEVDKKNVTVTDTRIQQSIEKARQYVVVPLNVTVEAVGTAETRTGVIPVSVHYDTYQLKDDVTFDHYEIDNAIHTITEGKDEYTVTVASVWSDGSKTTQEYKYATTHYFNTISLEDVYVKTFAYALSKIEGLTVGTESFVKNSEDGRFAEYSREDIYSALHDHEGNPQIKTVYFSGIPKVVFSIGEGEKKVEYVFDFISANFVENSDDILNGTSGKSGYEMKVFRNAVTASYGNAQTGVDSKVLEERANLYKAEKAAKGIEVQSKTKTYKAFAIDYTVKYFVLYNDDTKSELQTITTSRPWSLSYDGAWSMSVDGEVSQSTTDIVLTKTGENTEDQNVANGKWSCTTTSYTAVNNTTVDGQTKKNSWKLSVPTQMILTLYGTEVQFDKDAPEASHSNAKVELASKTATLETYTFSETLNAKVGTDTETSLGTGTITKAVSIRVLTWEWANAWQKVEGSLTKAHVEKVYTMSDGSKKTVVRDFSFTRGSQVYTYWETTEADNTESTGAAGWSVVSSTAKTSGDWHFNEVRSQLKFGVACKGSNQVDGWNLIEANNLSVDIEGDTYTFPEMTYSATANANQTKSAEDANKTTYKHTNTPSYTFGGYSMNLGAANGLIFVAKVVTPTSHDGFFPKSYGKIESYSRIACRNPHNQKDWGVGVSVKFTNGSVCGFITKDGNIEWGAFESGSAKFDGASPDTKGNLQNCTASDESNMMIFQHNGTTINFITYTDAKQLGWNWGSNKVATSHFPGSIAQKDGGKYQVLTIDGVNGSWDSSY